MAYSTVNKQDTYSRTASYSEHHNTTDTGSLKGNFPLLLDKLQQSVYRSYFGHPVFGLNT